MLSIINGIKTADAYIVSLSPSEKKNPSKASHTVHILPFQVYPSPYHSALYTVYHHAFYSAHMAL